jgi:hypothetical protein
MKIHMTLQCGHDDDSYLKKTIELPFRPDPNISLNLFEGDRDESSILDEFVLDPDIRPAYHVPSDTLEVFVMPPIYPKDEDDDRTQEEVVGDWWDKMQPLKGYLERGWKHAISSHKRHEHN